MGRRPRPINKSMSTQRGRAWILDRVTKCAEMITNLARSSVQKNNNLHQTKSIMEEEVPKIEKIAEKIEESNRYKKEV